MKLKLLWISDFIGTGYSSASIETINGLFDNSIDVYFDFYYFVLNTINPNNFIIPYMKNLIPKIDESHIYLSDKEPIFLVCNEKKIKNNEIIGYNYLYEHLNEINPDVCFILNDNGILNTFAKLIKRYNEKIKVIGYMPIDSSNIPIHFFDDTEKYVDLLLTMNQFSKKVILDTLFLKPIYVLNHPISSDLFYPINKNNAKNYISKLLNYTINENTFIITNMNNIQTRKCIHITFNAFAKFMDKYPTLDALLIIKDFKDEQNQIHTPKIKTYIENSIKIFPNIKNHVIMIKQFLTYEDLNNIYNSANVNLSTTYGEGWGLIPCESALCGIPQIVPNNTSHPEIFGDILKLIPTIDIPWIDGNAGEYEHSSGIISIMNGIKTYTDNGIIEKSIDVYTNIGMIGLTIFINSNVINSNLLIGTLKINENISFNTGLNNFEDLNKLIEITNPKVFNIFVEYCNDYEFIYEKYKDFIWNKNVTDKYMIEKIDLVSIKNIYNQRKIKVSIPMVEPIVDMIEYYYLNRNISISDGLLCRNKILTFNKNKIGKELKEILLS
jgi:hypothetical protein